MSDFNLLFERRGELVKVSAELTEYALCVLPPVYIKGGGFAMGEAYSHNSDNEPVYYCFLDLSEKTGEYFAVLATTVEAEKLFTLKKELLEIDRLYQAYQTKEHAYPIEDFSAEETAFYNFKAEIETKYQQSLKDLRINLAGKKFAEFMQNFVHCS